MFDQYIKLFNTSWVEPWIVEALLIMIGAFILTFITCKAIELFNGEQQ
jgi:hypothetical protein